MNLINIWGGSWVGLSFLLLFLGFGLLGLSGMLLHLGSCMAFFNYFLVK